ncbi:MAG: serine hydrolase [Rhizobiales bacterium]|nr:serine hydrolase [Hyphomicrobiales bacterium]
MADDDAGWARAEPGEVGLAANLGERIEAAVSAEGLAGLHGVVVVRKGRLVHERYFSGEDYRWGERLGHVTFEASTLHDVRSVSKSIVSLLYGIALAEGKVPPLDAPLYDQFLGQEDLAAIPGRRAIRVEHALSMTLGLDWNENLPYDDPRNSEIAMENSPDRIRYVLSRPQVAAPGEAWTYSGGATALIGRLIEEGTGTDLESYARSRLFAPLGIEQVEWIRGSDGRPAAASGLRMRPADLARIGQMALEGGVWNGRRVVPANWLRRSSGLHALTPEGLAYGYGWWIGALRNGKRWFAGFGNGGQRLAVVPSLDLVVVVTAGNYNAPEAWRLPVAVFVAVLKAVEN